jgi:hypothetical protein
MEQKIPIGFVISVTAGLMAAAILSTIFEISALLISVVFVGGVTAYIEYWLRTK